MLGIAEIGWMVRSTVIIGNAAREGSRAAALGKVTSDIDARINNYTSGLTVTITKQYSTDNGTTWTHTPEWPTDSGSYNGVASGALIRISVSTTHQQLTNFFPYLTGRTLSQKSIMRREPTSS
jgi:Flp pilus assembly protein TadG